MAYTVHSADGRCDHAGSVTCQHDQETSAIVELIRNLFVYFSHPGVAAVANISLSLNRTMDTVAPSTSLSLNQAMDTVAPSLSLSRK